MSEDARPPLVVTIWEEYGSGADEIGREVAAQLEMPYHAQAFSSEDIEAGAIPEEAVESEVQHVQSRLELSRVLSAMSGAFGGSDGQDFRAATEGQRALVAENDAIVARHAAQGGVIVGRNATVILADRPHTLHVLLTGDEERRTAHAAEVAGISLEAAQKRRRKEDKVRTDMSKTLYGWDPRDASRYHLAITTTRLPHDAAIAAIVNAAKAAAAV